MVKTSLSNLKKHYKRAVEEKKDKFTIRVSGKDFELLTAYAKYMIEYLNDRYAKNKMDDTEKFEIDTVGWQNEGIKTHTMARK